MESQNRRATLSSAMPTLCGATLPRRTLLRLMAGTAAAMSVSRFDRSAALAASQTEAAGEPKRGGQSVWALLGDPLSFDPHKANTDVLADVTQQFYESLTTYDADLQPVPALAVSWEMTDPMTYVWSLRPGVKFHDGREMTADDVVYSVERVLNPDTAAGFRFTIESIDRVEAIDTHTVRMTLNRPDPGLPSAFAINRNTSIIPAGAAEDHDLASEVIGTGPFRLAEYLPSAHVTLEKFPDYWDAPLPYLDQLTLLITGDEETRVAGLRAKQIDGSAIANESIPRLSDDDIQVLESAIYSPYTLEPNSGKSPTDDVRVRKAISLAVDREAYIERVVEGRGTLSGPIAPGYGDWFIPPDELGYVYDPEQAKALLEEAGVPPGTELVFPYSPTNPWYTAIAVITADMLRGVGLEVKLEGLESGILNTRFQEKDFHLYSRRRGFRHDPDAHLRGDFHSEGASNHGYKNDEVDALMDQARTETDHAARRELYLRVQRIILDENPHIFLFNTVKVDALQADVKGYEPRYTGFRETLRQTWLDR